MALRLSEGLGVARGWHRRGDFISVATDLKEILAQPCLRLPVPGPEQRPSTADSKKWLWGTRPSRSRMPGRLARGVCPPCQVDSRSTTACTPGPRPLPRFEELARALETLSCSIVSMVLEDYRCDSGKVHCPGRSEWHTLGFKLFKLLFTALRDVRETA